MREKQWKSIVSCIQETNEPSDAKRNEAKTKHNNIFIQIGGFEYVGNLIGN